jgi:hypothetical protein
VQRKLATFSQITLYLYRITCALSVTPILDPVVDPKVDMSLLDFSLLKSVYLSPLWYSAAVTVWGGSGEMSFRDERGRWAEIMYRSVLPPKSPLPDALLKGLKVSSPPLPLYLPPSLLIFSHLISLHMIFSSFLRFLFSIYLLTTPRSSSLSLNAQFATFCSRCQEIFLNICRHIHKTSIIFSWGLHSPLPLSHI